MPRKILLVGDLHFRSKRLDDIAIAWDSLVKWSAENKVDLIAQAGDIFDHSNVYGREASTGTIYNAFLAPFKEVEKPPQFVCVPGNHDMGGPRDKDALSPVDKYDWITVCRKISTLNFFDDLSISFLPWINRANLISMMMFKGENIESATKKVNETLRNFIPFLAKSIAQSKNSNRLSIVLGHLEVTGAMLDSGMPQVNGAYEFSPADLVSLNADIYAVGHIHKRQHFPGLPNENDGYLGSFCHLRFSDKDNPTGCRLIEYEGRKIISDKFIENKKSPKYFVIKSLDDKTWTDTDYVKFKGEEKPENLPANCIFEKEKTAAEFRIRLEEKADADTPVEKLLTSWAEISECKIDIKTLIEKAKTLGENAVLPVDPIGKLDRIDQIKLENVMSHLNTVLDFSNVSGICAIEGPNGSGKTSAMESIIFALYGEYPTRPKLELVPKTGHNQSSVELDFQSYGIKYKVKRDVKKNSKGACSQKALLFEQGVAEAKAGPKVDDVLNTCSRIVGDMNMVLSGVFSAQNEAGNIIDLKPTERKEIFARLLGTDKFIALSVDARTKATVLEVSIQADVLAKERMEKECEEESSILTEKKEVDRKLGEAKEQLNKISSEIEALNNEIKSLETSQSEREEAIKKKAELERKQTKIKEEGISLKTKRKELDTLDEAVVREKKRKLDQGRKILPEASKSLHDLEKKVMEIESSKKSLLQESNSKRSAAREQFSSHLLALRKDQDAKVSGLQKKKDELNDSLKAEMVSLTIIKSAVEQAKKQAALLEGFPDLDDCKKCPLAKDGIIAKKAIPSAESKLKEEKDKVTTADNQIREVEAEISSLKSREMPSIATFEPSLKLHQEADEKEKEANALSSEELAKKRDELAGKVSRIEAFIKENDSVDKEFESLSEMVEIKAKLDERIDSLKKTYLELDEEIKAIVIADSFSAAIVAKKKDHSVAKGELSRVQTEDSFLTLQNGRLVERLDGIAKKRQEIKKIEDGYKDRITECEIYDALAKAFGKNGIPQLIVEQMVPHFENIMSTLLEEFDDRWSIQVVSQKMNKTNTNVQERIDIIVDDGEGERDISSFSGGERRLLKFIVRIAFAIMQAERSGKGLKVLVMDEATDSMDENYAEGFVSMLTKLKNFNQIFVISHNHRILSQIPIRFTLSRDANGSKVEFCSS